MTSINIPAEQMEQVVHAAIMQMLTTEARERIVSDAVKYLNTPQDHGGYGIGRARKTPLQEAFEIGMRQATMSLVAKLIEDDGDVHDFVVMTLRTLISDFTTTIDAGRDHGLRAAMLDAAIDYLADQKADR